MHGADREIGVTDFQYPDDEEEGEGQHASGDDWPLLTADEAELMRVPAIRELVANTISKTLRIIRSDRRARLAADCIVMAIGGDLKEDGTTVSMTELARDHGMTKAAISKRVRELRARLALPTNRYLKSDDARRKYALSNARPIRLGD